MTDQTFSSVVLDVFDDQGSALIADSQGNHSRAEVLAKAKRAAGVLNSMPIAPGDRLAIFCASPSEAIIAFVATLNTEFIAVPIHPASPAFVIDSLLKESGAKAVVTDLSNDKLGSNLAALPCVNLRQMSPEVELAGPRPAPEEGEVATILFTSGTTGAPKGVQITYGNLEALTDQLVTKFFRVTDADTLLMAAPISNIYGVSMILVALRARATLAVVEDMRPQGLMKTLMRHKVTFVAGVPLIGVMLLRATKEMDDPLPFLRRVLLAGTSLDPALAAAFADKFGVEVMTGYAMTEAVPISMALDADTIERRSVGAIADNTQVQIVNEDMVPVEKGEPGEILIKGPIVTPGYWRAETLNASVFRDGWFRTGDVGRFDENGDLYLVDRIKDLIKTAGNTVYPSEIEATLKQHPGVLDAAVVPSKHETVGEVVTAFFIPREGQETDVADLRDFCRSRLDSWKVPRSFTSMESFPMTASGKVAKFRLLPGG